MIRYPGIGHYLFNPENNTFTKHEPNPHEYMVVSDEVYVKHLFFQYSISWSDVNPLALCMDELRYSDAFRWVERHCEEITVDYIILYSENTVRFRMCALVKPSDLTFYTLKFSI